MTRAELKTEEGLQLVAAWRASGKRQADFSREQGITSYALRYWVTKARQLGPNSERQDFVELDLPDFQSNRSPDRNLQVNFPSGIGVLLSYKTTAELQEVLLQVARL